MDKLELQKKAAGVDRFGPALFRRLSFCSASKPLEIASYEAKTWLADLHVFFAASVEVNDVKPGYETGPQNSGLRGVFSALIDKRTPCLVKPLEMRIVPGDDRGERQDALGSQWRRDAGSVDVSCGRRVLGTTGWIVAITTAPAISPLSYVLCE